MDKGANIRIMSEENNYGVPSDKPFSAGTGTYNPQAQSAPLMTNDNFLNESKYNGSGADRPVTMPPTKDKIDNGGIGDQIAHKIG